LADAIFPSNEEHIANSIEPLHHGLLNHKTEIENLHQGALNQKADMKNLHFGVLNHKTEIENLHQGALNQKADMKNLHLGVRNQKTDINNLHLGVLNHKEEIEKLCVSSSDIINSQKQHMSTQQLLHSAHDAKFGVLKKTVTATQESASVLDSLTKNHSSLLKTHSETLNSVNKQQKEQYEGLINHRNTLRDVVSAQDKMKTKSSKQEQSLLSMQRDITEIKNNLRDETTPNRLVDLNARTRDLEQKVSSLVSSNNVINSHISNLQAQASTDRPVL
jgi:chromosome segregation ATPase